MSKTPTRTQMPGWIASEERPWLERGGSDGRATAPFGPPCGRNAPMPVAIFGAGFDFPA